MRSAPRPPLVLVAMLFVLAERSGAAELPAWLPHYDLDIQLQVEQHRVVVRERVTWTNRHQRPADTVVCCVAAEPGMIWF